MLPVNYNKYSLNELIILMVSWVERGDDLHVRDHKNLNLYIFNKKLDGDREAEN